MNTAKTGYNRFLLLVAGLGGLLYGVDVGIIAGALPYLEATSGLNAGQLSFIVAAVLTPPDIFSQLSLAIPMLIVAYSSNIVSEKLRGVSKYSFGMRKVAGIILMVVGIYYLSFMGFLPSIPGFA